MKPITRFTLATITCLLASCGQEEGKDTAAPTGEQPVAAQPETPAPAADTPAEQPTPEPEPAPEPEPEPAPEPTPEERYNNGAGAPTDPVAAVEWYTEFSEAGIVDATYRLGMSYYAARSLPMNFVKAVEYLRQAAEQGHTEAAIKLAECYEWGVGVEADPTEAAKWRPEGVPAPAPIGEPVETAEPTPGPETADPEESDPEPPPGPETADPEESDPEPTTSAGADLAPDNLTGKTAVFNYETSQYMYSEDGEGLSGWQSFRNAQKNVKSCAEAFIAVGLKPKATRNILLLSTPAKGGKYVYAKTGPNTGTVEVNGGGAARTYIITFTSPTTGTATEEIFAGSMQGNVRNIQVTIK